MKKIILLTALIIGFTTPVHARKVAYQFEALRDQVELLAKNATKTWKAIEQLNKKLTCHEKKMFKRNRTYIYQNPYYTNNIAMPSVKTEDSDDGILVIDADGSEE